MRLLIYGMLWLTGFTNCKATQAQVPVQDAIAENMLVYQRSVGGWPKHIENVKLDYKKTLTAAEKADVQDDKYRNDATIDNHATTREIRYLVETYHKTKNPAYLLAAENGIRYLIKMQYPNGGFPQFFPDTSGYRRQVTFNDNAMINALEVLWDVAFKENGFDVVNVELQKPALEAIDKGIECIVRTQVTVNGKRTGWCAQYDHRTLLPAKARAYELPSISGMETVGIVEFLMKLENPSGLVKQSIQGAVDWLSAVSIKGYSYGDIVDSTKPKFKDRVLIPKPDAEVWARFYEIETNKPFFSSRDGVKKWNLEEVDHERRIGYAWYGTWPRTLLKKDYPKWKIKQGS